MKNRTKTILVLAMAVVLLTAAVGGTLAYLATKSGPVVNTFEPARVTCEVVETFTERGTTKSNVQIKNTGTTSAYIRAAVVGNWCNAAREIVAPWIDNIEYNKEDWTKVGGYWYYNSVVSANGGKTNDLFTSYTPPTAPVADAHLELTIVCQAIQAEPTSAVTGAWGVTVAADGTISK